MNFSHVETLKFNRQNTRKVDPRKLLFDPFATRFCSINAIQLSNEAKFSSEILEKPCAVQWNAQLNLQKRRFHHFDTQFQR